MIFNSITFLIFFVIVFTLYWLLKKKLFLQNCLLLISSLIFYGWWDWRFLFLIVLSSVVDYYCGKNIYKTDNKKIKKRWLYLSLGVNLGMLGFFKYFNFFIESFTDLANTFGWNPGFVTLHIILPVGISFYTFQTLSYTIDIYRDKIKPTNHIINFLAFVSFFPQLVAGPIERASHLLPQFERPRVFRYDLAVNGLRQILWGLIKKVVIADNCARFANIIFDNSAEYSGSTLLLGALLFTFQIYGDFSGYSDIAIGTSRLLGFDLMKNFSFPYFSRDIAEFWRRWHISLSTWFRDYLYIPLGGSRGSLAMKIRNTFIIFVVSGLWHGANWTFVFWGALNAVYFLPLLLTKNNRKNIDMVAENRVLPNMREFLSMSVTFSLTVLAWIFFRSDTLTQAFNIIQDIFSPSLFSVPYFPGIGLIIPTFVLIILFTIVEWFGRDKEFAIESIFSSNKFLRYSFFYVLLIILMIFKGPQQEFIYFQF